MTQTKFKEISAERYDEMLNILPPAIFERWGFVLGEAQTDRVCRVRGDMRTVYPAFVRFRENGVGDWRHFEAVGGMTISEFSTLSLPHDVTSNLSQ